MTILVSSVCRFTQSQPTRPRVCHTRHTNGPSQLCTKHGIYSRLFTASKKQYAIYSTSTCFPKLHCWLCLKESAQWARVGLGISSRSQWGGVAGACASAKSLSHTVILQAALKKDYPCYCTPLYMLYHLSLDNFYETLHLKHMKKSTSICRITLKYIHSWNVPEKLTCVRNLRK